MVEGKSLNNMETTNIYQNFSQGSLTNRRGKPLHYYLCGGQYEDII